MDPTDRSNSESDFSNHWFGFNIDDLQQKENTTFSYIKQHPDYALFFPPAAKKRERTIDDRLETNRRDAEEQQKNEKTKGFKIDTVYATKDSLSFLELPRVYSNEIIIQERFMGCFSHCQGSRDYMEDLSLSTHASFLFQGKRYPLGVVAVFDGHGGSDAAEFARANIAYHLQAAFEQEQEEETWEKKIFLALKRAFIKLDHDYQGENGTTAVVPVLLGDRIWIANVGDSRAILIDKNGNIVQATEDAKPEIPKHSKKVRGLGGIVCYDQEELTYRVNNVLSMARAIGDKKILGKSGKRCILPNPKITCFPLDQFLGGFLVMASDGLFEVASTNEVGQTILQMTKKNFSIKQICEEIVHCAFLKDTDTGDNITLGIVKL